MPLDTEHEATNPAGLRQQQYSDERLGLSMTHGNDSSDYTGRAVVSNS